MALLSLRAYAKHRGCALSAVQKAIKSGRIQTTSGGKIDAEKADAAWQLSTDHSKRREAFETVIQSDHPGPDHQEGDHLGGQGGDHPPDHQDTDHPEQEEEDPEEMERQRVATKTAGAYATARANREIHVARIKQLEYEELAGTLVKVEEIEKRIFEATRMTRDAILNIPNRIAAELASETDPHQVHLKLTAELTRALEELANVIGARNEDS